MKHKFFRYLIPVVAFVTIVGTGYSFFSYITFNNASLTGDNAPQVTVETRADDGTLKITPDDLYLSVYQRRIALNADRLNAVYTIGANWEEKVIVPITISATMTLDNNAQRYISCDTWTSSGSGVYTATLAQFDASTATQTYSHTFATPTFSFADDVSLTMIQEFLNMQTALSNSSITLEFNATMGEAHL